MDQPAEATHYPNFRWFILACFIVSNIAVMSVLIGPATIVFKISQELGASLGETSLVMMALVDFVLIFATIVGGFLIDKVGVINAWIMSMVLALCSTLLWPMLGHSIKGVAVMRVIAALSIAPMMASVASLTAAWFKASERAVVTGVVSASAALGVSIGLTVVPLLLKMTNSWQEAMSYLAVFASLGLALNVLALFGPKAPGAAIHPRAARQTGSSDLRGVWRSGTTYAMFGVMFAGAWVARAFTDLMPNYLAMPEPIGQGLGALAAGAFMSLSSYGQVTGSLLSGAVFERIFRGNAGWAMIVSRLLTGILCLAFISSTVAHNGVALSALLAMTGILIGIAPPMLFTFLAKTYPLSVVGRLGGVMQSLVAVGGTTGSAIGAGALSLTGNYTLSITLLLIVAIGGSLAAIPLIAKAHATADVMQLAPGIQPQPLPRDAR